MNGRKIKILQPVGFSLSLSLSHTHCSSRAKLCFVVVVYVLKDVDLARICTYLPYLSSSSVISLPPSRPSLVEGIYRWGTGGLGDGGDGTWERLLRGRVGSREGGSREESPSNSIMYLPS